MTADKSASPDTARFFRWEWLLLVAATGGWTLGWLLREPGMLQGLDYTRYYFFNAEWLRRSLVAGEWPWWNPHVGLGRPFFADLQTGVLYPPNWLHLPLGVQAATILFVWMHLVWAGAGMFLLGRQLNLSRAAAWFVATVLIFSPAMSVRAVSGQIHYLAALSYLPGLFWLLLRLLERPTGRRLAQLALASALQFLCGHPQVYWLTHLGLGLFTLVWMLQSGPKAVVLALMRLGAAVLLGLALVAPVLLPFTELIGESNRAQSSAMLSTQGTMGLRDWLGLVVPPHDGFIPDIEWQILVGAPVLLMALAALVGWREARVVRALAVLVVAAALLASALPEWLHRGVMTVLPGFAVFRLHARTSVLVAFALFLLAGRWLSHTRAPRWLRLAGAGLTLVSLLAALPALKRWYVLPAAYPAEPLVRGLVEELQRSDPAGVPPRISFSARLVRENSGMVTGHSTFNAYVSLYLGRVWEYVHAKAGLPPPETINTFPDVRIFERDPFLYDSMNLVAGFDTRSREMRLNPAPDPRVYLCFATEKVDGWHSAINHMVRGHDFHHAALVESVSLTLPGAGRGWASITSFANERVNIHVESDAPAVLVLAEAWYPGWIAEVNGAPATAFPVNGWMRGVLAPPGRSEVVWRYRSRWFLAGCVLGLAALVVLLAAWRKEPGVVA